MGGVPDQYRDCVPGYWDGNRLESLVSQNPVRARVWSTGKKRHRVWHYAVTCGDNVILYDNTGDYQKILCTALIEVTALRHMIIAGHTLSPYTGSTG